MKILFYVSQYMIRIRAELFIPSKPKQISIYQLN